MSNVGSPRVQPLVLFIYINDLPLASKMKIRLYADDANLSLYANSIPSLQPNLNLELSKLMIE